MLLSEIRLLSDTPTMRERGVRNCLYMDYLPMLFNATEEASLETNKLFAGTQTPPSFERVIREIRPTGGALFGQRRGNSRERNTQRLNCLSEPQQLHNMILRHQCRGGGTEEISLPLNIG